MFFSEREPSPSKYKYKRFGDETTIYLYICRSLIDCSFLHLTHAQLLFSSVGVTTSLKVPLDVSAWELNNNHPPRKHLAPHCGLRMLWKRVAARRFALFPQLKPPLTFEKVSPGRVFSQSRNDKHKRMLLVIKYFFAAWTSRFLLRNRLKQKLLESRIKWGLPQFYRDEFYAIHDILRLNET